jgi:aspartokinase/homoserine dehydrogenase 1
VKILKFGGSSVSTGESIQKVCNIILQAKQANHEIAVVLSAFGGVTDQLVRMSSLAASGKIQYLSLMENLKRRHLDVINGLINTQERDRIKAHFKSTMEELRNALHDLFLSRDRSLRMLDFIMSFGERMCSYIMCEYLISQGIDAEDVDSTVLIKTDGNFGAARVNIEATFANIKKHFTATNALRVIPGFIGSSDANEITTLGRGGSDYTASLFAAALDASEIERWTDVDGIMTADPRKVKDSFSIENMSYEEGIEISQFGARVIHPLALQPAMAKKIPMRIRNTFNPGFAGTVISQKSVLSYPGKGISSIDDIALLRMQGSGMVGLLGASDRLLRAMANNQINVILISQGSPERCIYLAVKANTAAVAKRAIEKEFALEIMNHWLDPVTIERDFSIIAIVGERMNGSPGISGKLFQVLENECIYVVAVDQRSSELSISVVVRKADEIRALNAVHTAFFHQAESHLQDRRVFSLLLAEKRLK